MSPYNSLTSRRSRAHVAEPRHARADDVAEEDINRDIEDIALVLASERETI